MGSTTNDSAASAMRARIVLAAAEGATNTEIAERVGFHPMSAGKWRNQFAGVGIEGLHDEPRPGAPRSITDADVERMIVTTLEQQPTDATHWSTRSLADKVACHSQTLGQMAPVLPGTPQRRTHDYRRNGTITLHADLDVASEDVIADMTKRHRAQEFRRFLNLIDKSMPDHLEVHVVLGNAPTQKTPAIQHWLVKHPRFMFHFTPTYGSWMNLVER